MSRAAEPVILPLTSRHPPGKIDCHFGLGYLAQLAVEAHNGVGGVDQPAYRLGILEIGAEIS